MLAPITTSFALLFPITFPIRFPTSFWTNFAPQIDLKINQKSIRNFFQNQATNKSYFSFIFDQIPETISCSSKMVDVQKSFQNLMFFVCFLTIRSCQRKQIRDMQRMQKSSKNTSKINDFFIDIKCIFDHFRRRFSSPKFERLGEGLGPDFGLDFRPCWGPKQRPNGIKKS
jgi:hypothetical protein